MKSEELRDAIGGIDEDLVMAADAPVSKPRRSEMWIRWGALAASVVLIAAAAWAIPGLFRDHNPSGLPGTGDAAVSGEGTAQPSDAASDPEGSALPSETFPVQMENPDEGGHENDPEGPAIMPPFIDPNPWAFYTYRVDQGRFSSYVKGYPITDAKIGGKLEDVTVTAGWSTADGVIREGQEEHARAEVFEIRGVPTDVAVAVRFMDPLAAQNTRIFYVITNPDADPDPLKDIYKYVPEGQEGQDPETETTAAAGPDQETRGPARTEGPEPVQGDEPGDPAKETKAPEYVWD